MLTIKFEGNNTSGSHKLNSAIAQAYYAKQQGLKGVTTETGAGQWGTALKCKETGEEKTILFGLTGTGYFDLVAYEKFNNGEMSDYIPADEDILEGLKGIPQFPGNEI